MTPMVRRPAGVPPPRRPTLPSSSGRHPPRWGQKRVPAPTCSVVSGGLGPPGPDSQSRGWSASAADPRRADRPTSFRGRPLSNHLLQFAVESVPEDQACFRGQAALVATGSFLQPSEKILPDEKRQIPAICVLVAVRGSLCSFHRNKLYHERNR